MSCFAVNLRNLLEKFFCGNCVIACFGGLNILKAENDNSGATSNIRQVSLLLTSKTFSTLNLKEKSEICQTSKIVVFEKILNNVSTGQKWVKSKVVEVKTVVTCRHCHDKRDIFETLSNIYDGIIQKKKCDKLYQNHGFTSLASGKYFAFVF